MLTDTSSNFVRSGSESHADVCNMNASMMHVSMMFLSMIYVYVYVFNTKKVSHWNPDMRVPKVLLPAPKKLDFRPINGQIWPKTGNFGQVSAFLFKVASVWFYRYEIFRGGSQNYKNPMYDVRRDVGYSTSCPKVDQKCVTSNSPTPCQTGFPCHSLGTGISLSCWTPSSEHHTLESSQDYRTVSILCWNFLP